ncbi:MAG: Xaa-Pro peptidase family protein [Bacteroidales bacterium]|nr:Xaa-Pro peptidase family protein [Bacteroidales bacterium]
MFSNTILPELRSRWSKIQSKINETEADGCLIGGNVNLFYLANRIFSGYCYFANESEPLFFVKRPVNLQGDNVIYIRKPEDIPALLAERGIALPKTLLLETDELSYNEIARLQTAFSATKLLNATTLLRAVRTIKSDYEIELLRHSGKIHADCYREIPKLYRSGMTDIDFSIEIEKLFRQKGSLGLFRVFGNSMEIFMGSILAGKNAEAASPYDFAMGGEGIHPSLPVGCNGTKLTEGMAVMVDMGGTFTGYITDMTRIFSVGKLTELAYKAHQVSIEIHREIESIAKPGVATADLYQIALLKAEKSGLSDYFMGYKQQAGFVGHGVGIEINESPVLAPRSKEILTEGHVFALEPKFVIPGTGAVGIENTFVVNKNSVENLTDLEEEIISL